MKVVLGVLARGGSAQGLRLQRHGRRERVRQVLLSFAVHGVALADRERGPAVGRQGRDEAERAVLLVVFIERCGALEGARAAEGAARAVVGWGDARRRAAPVG